MLPHQFDPDRYHPSGELFVVNPKDHFAPAFIIAYGKELAKEANKIDRLKVHADTRKGVVKGKPIAYWLRKKSSDAFTLAVKVKKFQQQHPEMVKYPD